MANDLPPEPIGMTATPVGLGAATKFNPQLWKPAELRAIFVARQSELAEMVRRVHQAKPKTTPQHVLITGHRGMGKSTLLHRLALAVEDDVELRLAWVPLLFREEQYTAATLDKFWRNALDALAEALERRAATRPELRADMRQLDAINAALEAEPSAAKREAVALATLREWAARHQSRLILLVDSTEQLFEALAHGKTKGEQDLWRLRECLSQDATFFWISCAYAPLEAQQGYDHPFHEFFAQLPLKPLNANDMRAAFLALARTFGAGRGLPPSEAEAHVTALLNNQPERLETLLRLAGGNPRTTVLLYQLLAAGGHDSVHSDLQRLLDDASPLYKDRLEHQLAVQPRQIVATLMESWAPMAAKAVADATHLPVTQINAQLSRLEASGWIEKVRLPGTKRMGYQVSERFFNVWYLMRLAPRRSRLRLSWLVEFMRVWFSAGERAELAMQRARGHRLGQWGEDRQMEFSRALSLSLDCNSVERAQLDLMLYSRTIRGRVGEVVIFEPDGEDLPFASIDDYRARFQRLTPLLMRVPFDIEQGFDKEGFVDDVISSLSLSLADKEQCAEKANTLSRAQCDALREMFQYERQQWLNDFCDDESLTELLHKVKTAEFFPDAQNLGLALTQARAWFASQPRIHALALMLIFNRLPTESAQAATAFGAINLKLLNSAGLLFAIARLLARGPEPKDAEGAYCRAIEIDAARAPVWNGLANLYRDHLRRFEDAESAYRKAMEIDPKNPVPFTNLALLLENHLHRYEEAELAYRKALEIDPGNMAIWNNLGNLLHVQLHRFDESESAYRKALEIDDTNAGIWSNFAYLLGIHLGRREEAEAAYRRAIEIDPENLSAWNGIGILLSADPHRLSEAETTYRYAIRIDESNAIPQNNLGNLLHHQMSRYPEAEAAFRKAIEIDERYSAPWVGLGNLFRDSVRRYDDAEVAYRNAIEIDPICAAAWNGLGVLLQNFPSRLDQAEAALRKAIETDASNAIAWSNLGNLLGSRLRRFDEAEAAYRQAIKLDPQHANGWNGLGNLLHDYLGREEEAEALYRSGIKLAEREPFLVANLARLMAKTKRASEARILYRQALALISALANGSRDQECNNLKFQAHLYLGESGAAASALQRIAALLSTESESVYAMWVVEEQAVECHALGLGLAMADLLAKDPMADRLKPIELALRHANGQAESLLDQPAELQAMAREIAQGWPSPLARAASTK
jgi:tetratricopeptide (TPR) repeat protein